MSSFLTRCVRTAEAWTHCRQAPRFLRRYAKLPNYNTEGLNAGLVQALLKDRDDEESKPTKNIFRIRAFDKAIKTIDKLDFRIQSVAEARDNAPGIGVGIGRRIQDYIDNYDRKSLVTAEEYSELQTQHARIKELCSIPGIGPVKASALVKEGCTSKSDLHKPFYRNMLSRATQAHLDFLEYLDSKVTRAEAEVVVDMMKREVLNSKWEVHIVGSYRRGATSMLEIDLLLLHERYDPIPSIPRLLGKGPKSWSPNKKVPRPNMSLTTLVLDPLETAGLLARTLSSSPTNWQGIVRIPEENESVHARLDGVKSMMGRFRRMDICFVSQKSRGTALLTRTGDVDFDRFIRLEASKLGLHLNEYGLWRNHSDDDPSCELGEHWHLCPNSSEEEVLREIGVDFITPQRRNFSNLKLTKSRSRKNDHI